MKKLILLAAIAISLPAVNAQPAKPSKQSKPLTSYKLELVARPPFQFLSRFGETKLELYPGGVRATNVAMQAFTRKNEKHVTVMSPVTRLYADLPVSEIGETLLALRTDNEKLPAPGLYPLDKSRLKATLAGMPATRYRLLLGPDSWMDVWSTDVVAENKQYRLLLDELVGALGKDFSASLNKIKGTPIKVVIKTRRFDEAVLLEPVTLTRSSAGEETAMQVGSFYARAPFTKVFNEETKPAKK